MTRTSNKTTKLTRAEAIAILERQQELLGNDVDRLLDLASDTQSHLDQFGEPWGSTAQDYAKAWAVLDARFRAIASLRSFAIKLRNADEPNISKGNNAAYYVKVYEMKAQRLANDFAQARRSLEKRLGVNQ